METVALSIINLRTNEETALVHNQRFINLDPAFQRDYSAWDDLMMNRFIESILLKRATNPIWTVLNRENGSEEILDGMHRLKTALNFLNNRFPLKKSCLSVLDGEKYHNKSFKNLDEDDKDKIRNYGFIFNRLDSSYRDDLNKLKDMYEILNRSSQTLNNYEFNKVLLKPFYDIVSAIKPRFIQTGFFKFEKDSRGNVDNVIIEMLSLASPLPESWSSVTSLMDEWINKTIGTTAEAINDYIRMNGTTLTSKLEFMCKITDFFKKNGLIVDETRQFKKLYLPYKLIIARCTYLINDISLFNRVASELIVKFKSEITECDIQVKLNCKTRNAQFQKKVIQLIDRLIREEIMKPGIERLFSKKMIADKLVEQKGLCTKCNQEIKPTDTYHGDHILPWSAGGLTVPDNLQVLHKRCHEIKSAS